jgi:hypothetical protein
MEHTFHLVEDQYAVHVTGISVSKYYAATYFDPEEGGELEYEIESITIGDADGFVFEMTPDQIDSWLANYSELLTIKVWAYLEEIRDDR